MIELLLYFILVLLGLLLFAALRVRHLNHALARLRRDLDFSREVCGLQMRRIQFLKRTQSGGAFQEPIDSLDFERPERKR